MIQALRKPWLVAVATALATIAACATATAAQARPPHVAAVRCLRHCQAVKPQSTIVISGRGFQPGMLAAFSVRRGMYVINVLRAARMIGPNQLRARVPSDAVPGALYVLGPTSHSNTVWLNVRAPGTCPSITGPGDAVTRWQPVILCVLGLLNQPQTPQLVADTEIIIRGESGGDPNSINNWDSNAAAGDPSRGLMQVIGATFAAYRDPLLLDNIYDPAANIYAGLNYGISRYGSISNIPGVKSTNAGGPYKPYKMAVR